MNKDTKAARRLDVTALAFAAFGLLTTAGPTVAAPDRVLKESLGPVEWQGQPVLDCGSFVVLSDGTAKGHATLRFDAAGELVQVVWHEFSTDFLYNSTDPSKFVGSIRQQPSNGFERIGEDRFSISGASFKFTLPGGGVVVHEVGRAVYALPTDELIFVAGPHQVLEGDLAALCAALA